ncbi:MAG: tRNA pseudouridine(55) synthase TruB [Candidatus Eisenbacteria bacterium]|uniref:tRNA pseudouridine synthase B n=1 Tax=Eiseniibacteriota bacterium TaxID=2212470 RepID=A0A9D6LAE5_UNCEI|nr:tRNA pseudouridine(55) synthase TruB [Candidatus Eisenbacteria bacterium]
MDKPVGMTSHDVVVRVRRALASPGAGHLGTLDPGASGLLIVALGAATRAIPVWQGGEKTYEATLRLGVTTRTQDLDGEVIAERPVDVSEARVREAARAFVGAIDQVPPMVSAVRVGGRRLHDLARRGIEVERAPRPITVASWEWLGFALPEATFRVRCSAGTYVRTLAHDLGAALGTGAALASLRRTRSEPFGLEQALPLAELERLAPAESLARAGTPLDRALAILPAIALDAAAAEAIGRGGRPSLADPADAPVGAGPRSVVLRDPTGRALALCELRAHPAGTGVIACPHVVFPWAVREGRS